MYLPAKKRVNQKIPIILEFGTLNTRIGYAGYDQPSQILPTEYAFNQESNNIQLMNWFSSSGIQNAERKNLLQNGAFTDLEVTSSFIKNISNNILQVDVEKSPIFLVEPPMQSRENRLKLVEMIFEDCGFQGVFLHKGPILSSYIFAKENMILIDCGADGTVCAPIQEGYINNKAVMRTEIGGEFLTNSLFNILKNKQKIRGYCHNFDKLTESIQQWSTYEVVREIKHRLCKLYEMKIDKLQIFFIDFQTVSININSKYNDNVDNTVYELPDKSKIEMSKEIYSVPELLFTKIPEYSFEGIQHLIKLSIEKVDTEARRELMQNIMIVGGSSLLINFIERLTKEIYDCDINNGLQNRAKIYTTPNPNERLYSSWLGASIVGCMTTFEQMLMTKRDYEEHGSILIERKLIA